MDDGERPSATSPNRRCPNSPFANWRSPAPQESARARPRAARSHVMIGARVQKYQRWPGVSSPLPRTAKNADQAIRVAKLHYDSTKVPSRSARGDWMRGSDRPLSNPVDNGLDVFQRRSAGMVDGRQRPLRTVPELRRTAKLFSFRAKRRKTSSGSPTMRIRRAGVDRATEGRFWRSRRRRRD